MIDNMNGVQMASYLDGKFNDGSKYNELFIYITPIWYENDMLEIEFDGFKIDGFCSEVDADAEDILEEERFEFNENPLDAEELYDLMSNLRLASARKYKVKTYAFYHGDKEVRRYYELLMKALVLTKDFEMNYEWG